MWSEELSGSARSQNELLLYLFGMGLAIMPLLCDALD